MCIEQIGYTIKRAVSVTAVDKKSDFLFAKTVYVKPVFIESLETATPSAKIRLLFMFLRPLDYTCR